MGPPAARTLNALNGVYSSGVYSFSHQGGSLVDKDAGVCTMVLGAVCLPAGGPRLLRPNALVCPPWLQKKGR